eukprot:g6614.t1
MLGMVGGALGPRFPSLPGDAWLEEALKGRTPVGLFGGCEVILHAGPVFVGEDYQCRRQLVACGETPKAEFRWTRTFLYEKKSGKLVAKMTLQDMQLKNSLEGYAELRARSDATQAEGSGEMVADEGKKTGMATNGVVESFYDFFAQLYSSSFTAQGAAADPGLASLAPWANELDKARIEADLKPEGLQSKADRCARPHRLEFGWPEDALFQTPTKTPKVACRTPRASRESLQPELGVAPHGFPEPMEQREQVARQQEEFLRQQQCELREQREQYFQEQEAKIEDVDAMRFATREDLIDQHVAYFLRKNPEVKSRHKIQRIRPNTYLLDSREVQIEWQYATEPGGQGFLVVVDGPLRQPFSDYMMDTEELGGENATYDGQDIVQSNLHLIARDRRISFNDTHKVYNRLEAMKVAKEQALVREKAAGYVKDGREVPQDLMARYKKTLWPHGGATSVTRATGHAATIATAALATAAVAPTASAGGRASAPAAAHAGAGASSIARASGANA